MKNQLIALTIGLLLIFSFTSCNTLQSSKSSSVETGSADEHYLKGATLVKQGQFPAAIEELRAAVRQNPDNVQYIVDLGNTYLYNRQNDLAVKILEKAAKMNSKNSFGQYSLGVAYYYSNQLDKAISALGNAVALEPNYTVAYVALGHANLSRGNGNAAAKALQKAVALAPQYALAHVSLGSAYVRVGRYNDAVETLQKALKLDPKIQNVHANLGWAYCFSNNPQQANLEYDQAVQAKDPNAPFLKKTIDETRCNQTNVPGNTQAANKIDLENEDYQVIDQGDHRVVRFKKDQH